MDQKAILIQNIWGWSNTSKDVVDLSVELIQWIKMLLQQGQNDLAFNRIT